MFNNIRKHPYISSGIAMGAIAIFSVPGTATGARKSTQRKKNATATFYRVEGSRMKGSHFRTADQAARAIASRARRIKKYSDIIFVDSPPGMGIVTRSGSESWLVSSTEDGWDGKIRGALKRAFSSNAKNSYRGEPQLILPKAVLKKNRIIEADLGDDSIAAQFWPDGRIAFPKYSDITPGLLQHEIFHRTEETMTAAERREWASLMRQHPKFRAKRWSIYWGGGNPPKRVLNDEILADLVAYLETKGRHAPGTPAAIKPFVNKMEKKNPDIFRKGRIKNT